MCSLLTAAPCCCPMLPAGFRRRSRPRFGFKTKVSTMAVTVKNQKKMSNVRCVKKSESSMIFERVSRSWWDPLFFQGWLSPPHLGRLQRAESRLKRIEIIGPETCMLFGATCKCRVELLLLKKKQWTWEVSN